MSEPKNPAEVSEYVALLEEQIKRAVAIIEDMQEQITELEGERS